MIRREILCLCNFTRSYWRCGHSENSSGERVVLITVFLEQVRGKAHHVVLDQTRSDKNDGTFRDLLARCGTGPSQVRTVVATSQGTSDGVMCYQVHVSSPLFVPGVTASSWAAANERQGG